MDFQYNQQDISFFLIYLLSIYSICLQQSFINNLISLVIQLEGNTMTQVGKNIDKQDQNLPAEEIMKLKYSPLCTPTKGEYLKLNGCFDKQTGNALPEGQQFYRITDEMKIGQLRGKWYKNNVKYDPVKENQEQKYSLIYDSFQLLQHYQTISQIKKRLSIPHFNKDVLIRVQFDWEQDQSAISYIEYQKTNHKSIWTPIRLRGKKQQESIYFYVQSELQAQMKTLKAEIEKQLLSPQSLVEFGHKKGESFPEYTLKIKKDILSKGQLSKLKEQFKDHPSFADKHSQQLQISSFYKYEIRHLCAPGQVIYLEFTNMQKQIVIKDKLVHTKDPYVQLICYGRDDVKEVNNIISKKVIKKKYSQIRNIKASTLLNEHRIPDALFTCINFKTLTIKPEDKFSKLDSLIQESSQEVIQLRTIPQNFMYYKELCQIGQQKKVQMKDILDHLCQNQGLMKQENRQKCRNKTRQRVDSLINSVLEDQEFLDPIILYTSPFVYNLLNKFLRNSSVSLVRTEDIRGNLQDFWYYPFCEKLIKSLLKLPNSQGTYYRGSINFEYGCTVGQIIEWNSFVSTSQTREFAFKFIEQQQNNQQVTPKGADLSYLFEISTYSGKNISKYSYFKNESQVLLMPYTKFKVQSVQKIQNQNQTPYTLVTMIQIPIPKRVPGDIIVWIDSNIYQNSKVFNKIVLINGFESCDLIQLVSNEHFEMWLNEFKHTLSLPGVRVHLITNMNRPPYYQHEGLRTLEIIRSFNPKALVVFYIGSKQKTRAILHRYWLQKQEEPDENVHIAQSFIGIDRIFVQHLIKKSP